MQEIDCSRRDGGISLWHDRLLAIAIIARCKMCVCNIIILSYSPLQAAERHRMSIRHGSECPAIEPKY